uniref:Uncharacterized protein n=1 Tax=Chromera velia CCMP2878 TaxID=1169474 RepID=A0A0G4HP80_9ALVE|eukprot:Cvel_29699.t1-p1 / transcript=Cvel_29699.t1 / gene=Cvel_29699 / organism=Chromera_velia_CCMP2878 / gene_product=hypothetical protein / transcript_product=hypothetical protein / location=Cvel_scaffold4114:8800-9882(-) / protein_length=361 / sequence_SO=supercontig / SO=protein_coding / is_pseudo=false
MQNRGSSPGERGFETNLTCPAVPFQGADRGELSHGGNDWHGGVPAHDDNDHVSQSSRREGGETCEMQEEGGFINIDGGVIFVMPQTTFDFGQSSPVMAPAGGDGQMNEPTPMELCQIERCGKEEGGVGKDLFESLYRVGSWELREQIHCQRSHSPSPQLNRLETGRQGNDFDDGNPGKAERQKQKRQEKKERKRQEKHEREILAVRQKKETDNPWSPLPPISEGVEEPAVSSDGLILPHQARRQQERREAKDREKKKKRAAHKKPKTPVTVPLRDPLQHEYWEDVSFRFWLGREDLIPNIQGIGTADWNAFLARRGCGQTGETFYREMYGNGGSQTLMPYMPEVRPAVRQMRSVRTARTSA